MSQITGPSGGPSVMGEFWYMVRVHCISILFNHPTPGGILGMGLWLRFWPEFEPKFGQKLFWPKLQNLGCWILPKNYELIGSARSRQVEFVHPPPQAAENRQISGAIVDA